mmetsp:Transcript_309/g.1023  ORF Transcript_309/g.1023 Transcript_309/m.1023 type:complete len:250 (+) Transcript_309:375-1124(+)
MTFSVGDVCQYWKASTTVLGRSPSFLMPCMRYTGTASGKLRSASSLPAKACLVTWNIRVPVGTSNQRGSSILKFGTSSSTHSVSTPTQTSPLASLPRDISVMSLPFAHVQPCDRSSTDHSGIVRPKPRQLLKYGRCGITCSTLSPKYRVLPANLNSSTPDRQGWRIWPCKSPSCGSQLRNAFVSTRCSLGTSGNVLSGMFAGNSRVNELFMTTAKNLLVPCSTRLGLTCSTMAECASMNASAWKFPSMI